MYKEIIHLYLYIGVGVREYMYKYLYIYIYTYTPFRATAGGRVAAATWGRWSWRLECRRALRRVLTITEPCFNYVLVSGSKGIARDR